MSYDTRAGAYLAHDAPPDEHAQCDERVMVFRFGGSLLYPAMASTKDEIIFIQKSRSCQYVVLDFTCCTRIDYTGCQVR